MQKPCEIRIKKYSPTDMDEVISVCHSTGFMGDTLKGTNRFNDRRLFAYLFCWYYLRYEPEHCFVAVNDSEGGRVIGYIIGTTDTDSMIKRSAHLLYPRILIRLILVTLWRHTGSFRELLYWLRNGAAENDPRPEGFPAHLHINILPGYQSHGIGSRLITEFETMCREHASEGIYLETSNHNRTAIPFYQKNGYIVLSDKKMTFWSGIDDYRKITFGKKLE